MLDATDHVQFFSLARVDSGAEANPFFSAGDFLRVFTTLSTVLTLSVMVDMAAPESEKPYWDTEAGGIAPIKSS